jgi:iron complex transport system ATP-binding protein
MTEPATIAAAGITVALGSNPALVDLTLQLDRPGLVALAGPNGAGKSTFLRALAGLIPFRGRLTINGEDTTRITPARRARTIAYMPQDRTVHWNLTVADLVDLARLPHRGPHAAPSAADRSAVTRALGLVDAVHLSDRPILALSGGERARVLMARALAQETPILLADEPAAGLDPAHQWALFQTLAAVADRGTRVVVAMHDLPLMARFAATVVLIDAGRLVAVGPPDEVLTPDRIAAVYGVTTMRSGADLIITGRTAK